MLVSEYVTSGPLRVKDHVALNTNYVPAQTVHGYIPGTISLLYPFAPGNEASICMCNCAYIDAA